MSDKPRCFNRAAYEHSMMVQDGWMPTGTVDGKVTLAPELRIIDTPHDPPECKQWAPHGAARMYRWDCAGCRWYAEAIRGQAIVRSES